MGGLLICISILIPTLLWADLSNPFIWVVMLSTLAFGAIGFADDYIKVVHRRNQGLTGRQKLALQFLVSAVVAVALLNMEVRGGYSTRLVVPFVKRFRPDLVWEWMGHIPHMHWLVFLPFVVFVMIVIAGSSNAVNLTDGLDGLAIGCTIIAAGALTVLTYVSGHVVFADYLELQRMPMVSEVTVFCGAMVGASIGFLWYNAHPAEVFMGDVGSLALGGAIATVAVVIKQELLLPFIGGVFILEALSVMLQIEELQAASRSASNKHAYAAASCPILPQPATTPQAGAPMPSPFGKLLRWHQKSDARPTIAWPVPCS